MSAYVFETPQVSPLVYMLKMPPGSGRINYSVFSHWPCTGSGRIVQRLLCSYINSAYSGFLLLENYLILSYIQQVLNITRFCERKPAAIAETLKTELAYACQQFEAK